MGKIEYAPKALEDLQRIQNYISQYHGENVAKKVMKTIITNIKRLEQFPASGVDLARTIDVPTDYYYLFVEKNYAFYRLEEDIIRVIRVLNEQQDYMQILFGISTISDEN